MAASTKNQDPMATSRFFRQGWQVSLFWLLIALASALEMGLFLRVPFATSLRFELVRWIPWAALSPCLIWMTAAYPLERATWHRTIWPHLLACALTVVGLGMLGYCMGPPPTPAFSSAEIILFERNHPLYAVLLRSTFQLPTYWAVVGVAHAFKFHQRAREKEQRESELVAGLTQARLEVLRMQINPHFLFNTLNSISALIPENPQAADEMIGLLSGLLRATLKNSNRQEVALRDEISFLRTYLAIQKHRFGERLQIEELIESASLDAMVPVLVLQPLVENAITHGIEPRLAPGKISIRAFRNGDFLILEVADNGVGLSRCDRRKPRTGVGINNIQARLRELYGADAKMETGERPGGGFLAHVHIPWNATPIEPKSVKVIFENEN